MTIGRLVIRALIILFSYTILVSAQAAQPLQLEKTIELPDVQGRIDHMSIDVKGERLFVSALGNNTVEIVDVKAGKRLNTIHGLQEPQGVLYVPAANRIYVANDKDGSVRIFDGTSLQELKTLEYGDDADNLRYDSATQHIYVGFGDGGLGEFDSEVKRSLKRNSMPIQSHFSLKRTAQEFM